MISIDTLYRRLPDSSGYMTNTKIRKQPKAPMGLRRRAKLESEAEEKDNF